MNENDIRQYIEEANKKSDERMRQYIAEQNQSSDERLDRAQKESDEKIARLELKSDEKIARLQKQSDEKMEQYLGALKEDSQHKMDAIMEVVKPLLSLPGRFDKLEEAFKEVKYKVDIIFEHVGNLTEDVEMLKETVARHESILQQK